MRKALYKDKPSYRHCYFYSAQFVDQDRPFIVKSEDYEYYNIRDWFLENCKKGHFEKFGITRFTSVVVRRIDILNNTKPEDIDATIHLSWLQKKHDALNNPDRPTEPATLMEWLCEREDRLDEESKEMEIELMMQNIPAPKNKNEYLLLSLKRKYSFIYKDLEKQWSKIAKRRMTKKNKEVACAA